jgi:molybdate transport system substrate-binding protein
LPQVTRLKPGYLRNIACITISCLQTKEYLQHNKHLIFSITHSYDEFECCFDFLRMMRFGHIARFQRSGKRAHLAKPQPRSSEIPSTRLGRHVSVTVGLVEKMPMKARSLQALLCLAVVFCLPRFAAAAEIKVMLSGGFSAAYKLLVPEFQTLTGHKVETAYGPSMGDTPQAIPNRLERGETADVVIMAGPGLDALTAKGKIAANGRFDLAESVIGAAVREGASKPDIGSVEAFKKTILAAKSIAYSDSASGVYISTELFQRLGVLDQMKSKARMIPAEPVARVVARGEAELGFQQISELKPVPGIVIIGELPAELQKVTIFAAGLLANAKEPEAAKALIAFLASDRASPAVTNSGMKPIVKASR